MEGQRYTALMPARGLVAAGLLLALLVPARAASTTVELVIAAGQQDRMQVPVTALVRLPRAGGEIRSAVVEDPAGNQQKGQITRPGLLNERAPRSDAEQLFELHFFLGLLRKGETANYRAHLSTDPPVRPDGFDWFDVPIQQLELRYMSRPALRYVFRTLDDSSPEGRAYTSKPFHHLYDPGARQFVTKGPGGLNTQERGLFFGFGRATYGGGKVADTWDCSGDTHQAHIAFLEQADGPILGRQQMEISWRGPGKEEFAVEHREVTLYNSRGGRQLDFTSRLESRAGAVHLEGDAAHAGFHFRADNEVATGTRGQTLFLRPDGAGKPGEARGWPADAAMVNLPWDAMTFTVGEDRYTVLYLDRPQNPKPARYSEAAYGRLGSAFDYALTPEHPLEVAYRLWLTYGNLGGREAAERAADFAAPPAVTVKAPK